MSNHLPEDEGPLEAFGHVIVEAVEGVIDTTLNVAEAMAEAVNTGLEALSEELDKFLGGD